VLQSESICHSGWWQAVRPLYGSRHVVPSATTTTTTVRMIAERSLTALSSRRVICSKAAILGPEFAPTPAVLLVFVERDGGQVGPSLYASNLTNVLIDCMTPMNPRVCYSPAGASGIFLGLDYFVEVRVSNQTLAGVRYEIPVASNRGNHPISSNHFPWIAFLTCIATPLWKPGTISDREPSSSLHSCATNSGPASSGLWLVSHVLFCQLLSLPGKCGHHGHCDLPYALAHRGLLPAANIRAPALVRRQWLLSFAY